MSENQSTATPSRLARIASEQAVGALTETMFFGLIGLTFSYFGLVLLADAGIGGFLEFVKSRPELGFYFLASGIIYVAILAAVRTEVKAGLNTQPSLESVESDSYADRVYENILSFVVGSSYTASIIGIGALVTYELVQYSPVFGIAFVIGYPYFEHYAITKAAEGAETVEDADVILTPATVVATLIVFVPLLMLSPVLVLLRVVGLVASVWSYLPSMSGLGQSIRATHERLVFVDWFISRGRQRIH